MDDYDDEPSNSLIDALFDEVEDLRMKVRFVLHQNNYSIDSLCRIVV